MKILLKKLIVATFLLIGIASASAQKAENPIVFADVPDMSIVRV